MAAQDSTQAGERIPIVDTTPTALILAGMVLAAGGWAGLIWLIFNTLPTVPNRWAFFALLHISVTGTALPLVVFLAQRVGRRSQGAALAGPAVRISTWVALFVTSCVWLRIPRLLSIPTALVVLVAVVLLEFLLRLREATRWRPE